MVNLAAEEAAVAFRIEAIALGEPRLWLLPARGSGSALAAREAGFGGAAMSPPPVRFELPEIRHRDAASS
jgi:hypothetical protein